MTPSDGAAGHDGAAPPPRLTVLTARDADVAVVLRRGPSSWVRLHRWDSAADTVEDGGWLRARVSGRRVDLSPDGRLSVAFVAAHGRTVEVRRDTWVDLLPLGDDASLDVDRAGRALVGRGGRLEAHAGNGDVEVIADLTDQVPDPAPVPDWAYVWPGPHRGGAGGRPDPGAARADPAGADGAHRTTNHRRMP
jgi:hypothetical protein